MARVIAFLLLVLFFKFTASSSNHKEQQSSEPQFYYTPVNEKHVLHNEQLPYQYSYTEKIQVLKNRLPKNLDLSKIIESYKLQEQNKDTVLLPKIYNREINPVYIQANNNEYALPIAANSAHALRDSVASPNIHTNIEKAMNSKQSLPQIQTQVYENIAENKRQASLLRNIKQLVANVQKKIMNTGERDIIIKTDFKHQTDEAQVTSKKIIAPNNNNNNRKQIVFEKAQISSSKINIENKGAHPSTKNRVIVQDQQNHEVLVTKNQDNIKDREIPVFEIIHDDTPKPVYHASVSVLPTRLSNGESWSNKSLHDVIKKAITEALDSYKITLCSNYVQIITDEVTLAVRKSLGLTPSGTRGNGNEEVGNDEPSQKISTDATSPVLFPVSSPETEEDRSLENIQEVERLYEDGSERKPLSQSNAKTIPNKNNQNLVTKENNFLKEIIIKEKQIQKKKEEKENQEEEDEEDEEVEEGEEEE